MMFVLISTSLLSLVCGSKANTGSSAVKKICQQNNFCITLREGVITAEAGLCVVIPCSFTTDSNFTTTNIIWSKCEKTNKRCSNIFTSNDPREVGQSGFEGRVSLMGPNHQGNCRIIIYDLRKSDSGSYQLKVEGTVSTQRTRYVFPKKASLSVKDLTQKPTVMVPPLTEGQQTTMRCTAPGRCPGSPPEITWIWRGGGLNESPITGNTEIGMVSVYAPIHSSTLTFTPSSEYHGINITCKVSFKNSISTEKTETLSVTYLKAPVIRGHRAVKLGAALHLTCSVDSFPPSVVTWTKLGSNKTLKENTRTAKLIIPYMTAEDVGKFICSASQQITKQTARTEVSVTILSSILNSSACEVQSEVLTCVCISQGFPLPTIEWPLLKKHTQHCITTSVTNNTVNTNISVSAKDHNSNTVVCVSRNVFGEVKKELKVVIKNVTKSESEEEEEAYSHGSVLLWTVAAAVSLIVNVVLIICVLFFWTKRKTVKPNQEDRTYMSLQKTDQSPEYDVICQPLN